MKDELVGAICAPAGALTDDEVDGDAVDGAVRRSRVVVLRTIVGGALLVVGLALLFASGGVLSVVGQLGLAMLATGVGVALLLGPWIVRLWRDLDTERRQRIRSEERSEMAAHLHDSVLQTLTLIQRHADAPARARMLARRQERELRAWLFDERAPADGVPATLVSALEGVVTDVEDRHEVEVDLVVVGECRLDRRVEALVAAVREAAHNAARHSGAEEVSVYVEVEADKVTAYVRDRGSGFDPDAVEAGRLGISGSIVGRMARAGGRAEVHSTPGEGTEVVIDVARSVMTTPKVFLVDDHHMFRAGVRAELGDRVEVVGEAADVESAVLGIRQTLPEVVLLDVHLPGGGGKTVIETLKPTLPDLVFLVLSVSDAAEDVIVVIRAGARGYVTKTISAEDLAAAVLRVRDGDAVFSPRLAGFVLDVFAWETPPELSDPELDQLSPRER